MRLVLSWLIILIALSHPICLQDELTDQLRELEQDVLNERLAGAEAAPTTALPTAREERESSSDFLQALSVDSSLLSYLALRKQAVEEDDEDAQLKELQAALAM